jgi:hypothetical protein
MSVKHPTEEEQAEHQKTRYASKSQNRKLVIFNEIYRTPWQEKSSASGADNKLGTLCRVRGKN